MKILTLLFILCSLVIGQQNVLFDGAYDEDGSGSENSDDFNLTDLANDKYLGLEILTLDIDSLVSLTDATSTVRDNGIFFINQYRVNGDWYSGDTIRWDRFDTSNIENNIIDRDLVTILPLTYHDSLLVWVNEPDSTNNIMGLPYDRRRVKMLWADSINIADIDLRQGIH